jgi:formate hydrogenlyase subunit 3/multisubunit Na+/H+ antiporter MnhD subunit
MIASIICSALAIGAVPPLFGGLAIFFGYQAYKRDAGIGKVCMAIGGVALIVGFVLGALWGAENIRF